MSVKLYRDNDKCHGYGNSIKIRGKWFTSFEECEFITNNLIKEEPIHTGVEILDLMVNKKFKEGDKIIATQEDNLGEKYTSTFTYKHIINDDFEFVDDEFDDCVLDAFDLVNCSFSIVKYMGTENKEVDEINKVVKLLNDEFNKLSAEAKREFYSRYDIYRNFN